MITHDELKTKAFKRKNVKEEYDKLHDEFSILDEFLQARMDSGMTQAEIAERIGTTQSAIARLESQHGKRSPTISTLQKYAKAIGYKLELKLIKESNSSL